MRLTWTKLRLDLQHPWTLARGTSASKEYWFVELEQDGTVGYGEAAHNPRYDESLESIEAFFELAAPLLEKRSPRRFQSVSDEINRLSDGQFAAKAAIDIALHDWAGKSMGAPLHLMLGLDPTKVPPTSYSIGIGSSEQIREKVSAASDFPVLKIKMGSEHDEETLSAVRSLTNLPLRIDANEGWSDREQALRKIEWLSEENVEFVEQPLPAGNLEDMLWLKARSPLPIFADEDACQASDLVRLAEAFDGINIKLMKCGGIQKALSMIHGGRCLGLKLMLGCMIESSLGITAAAQLAPLVDVLDLDGNLLLSHDPFQGAICDAGMLALPLDHGIGVRPRETTD